jgi:hypothetical protein
VQRNRLPLLRGSESRNALTKALPRCAFPVGATLGCARADGVIAPSAITPIITALDHQARSDVTPR